MYMSRGLVARIRFCIHAVAIWLTVCDNFSAFGRKRLSDNVAKLILYTQVRC